MAVRKLQPAGCSTLLAALTAAMRGSSELRYVHRLHAVLLVSIGRSCYEVGHWFAEDPRTVERWVHAYELAGPEGLVEHRRRGRPAHLTPMQQDQLRRELAVAPAGAGYPHKHWTGKLLARHLESRYGVCISLRHCQRLLHLNIPGTEVPAPACGRPSGVPVTAQYAARGRRT